MNRPLKEALFYERDGDLNVSQLAYMLMALVGVAGFIKVNFFLTHPSVTVVLASWAYLSGAGAAVLIASLPLAKAKILANAKLPGDLSRGIASIRNVETSTDIEELSRKSGKTPESDDIG